MPTSTANSATFESFSPLFGKGLMSEEGRRTFLLSSGDEWFTAWLLRGARAITYKVLVTDMVELWEHVSVVRIVPFVSGFVSLIHYLVLLIFRARNGIWNTHTMIISVHVFFCGMGMFLVSLPLSFLLTHTHTHMHEHTTCTNTLHYYT